MSGQHPSVDLAQFIACTGYRDLPPAVIELARRGILDAIGCGLYGATLPQSAWIRASVDTATDGAGVTVWGAATRARPEDAALVNGTAIHSTEMAETFIRAVVHPGNVVVPAAVALAEQLGRSGEDLLAAVALGYEVLSRIGLAAGVATLMEQRLHTFSLLGVFGAATAAAKLHFGDDCGLIAHTLGIVANLAPTTLLDAAREGATIKDVFEGQSAAAGVAAARYAALGASGPSRWAEEWFPAVVRSPDLAPLTDGLGHRWEMASGGLRIKMLPVMGLVQPTVGAVRNLVSEHPLAAEAIDHIRVDSTKRAVIAAEVAPATLTAAKASIPFTVAAMLVHPQRFARDPFMLDFFTDELLHDNQVLDLAARCTVVVDDDFERNFESAPVMKYESRVTVVDRNGRSAVGYADIWPATSKLSFADIRPKFMACAETLVTHDRASAIYRCIATLEASGVPELADLVSGRPHDN